MFQYRVKKCLYMNPLAAPENVADFRMEGGGGVTFPLGRMRLESTGAVQEGQASNIVYWCPRDFPDDIEISWDFVPIWEPGLAMLFLAAKGRKGEDLFDPRLAKRDGPYMQYNRGDINALHVSYFRRNLMQQEFSGAENQFQTCNLRKSYGFHLVAQGLDGIPTVLHRAYTPYRLKVVKAGAHVAFYMNDILSFHWEDDGQSYGAVLSDGKIGFRQMVPLIAEYANLQVHTVEL